MKKMLFTDCVSLVGTVPKEFSGNKRYVSTGAVDCDHITESEVELVDFDNRPSRANLVASKGDVLFAKMAKTRKTLLLEDEMVQNIYSTGFCAVRAKKGVVLSEALYYYIGSSLFSDQKDKYCTGATQKAITNDGLSKIHMSVPTIQEQQAFCSKMFRLCRLIVWYKKLLVNLDILVKSRFVELFGTSHDGRCNTAMIGSICRFQQGTQIPVEMQIEEPRDGYVRFLRIIDYTQAPQPPRFVNVDGKVIDEKSVVIVRYGATAGFVGRGYSGILANNLFEVIPNETFIDKEFLYLALKHGTFERDIHEKAFGAAMPALSFSMMNDIPIVVPSHNDQKRFANFVAHVAKSKHCDCMEAAA